MKREEKSADDVWYYVREYCRAHEGGDKFEISKRTVSLDRAIIRAIRSRGKL